MKKLNENQLEKLKQLKQFKNNGGVYVYIGIRKYFSTWYVRLFHVDNLLENKMLPSYWYKEKGDCTELQAIKNGYVSLYRL